MDYRGFLAGSDLQALVDVLARDEYGVVGPVIRDNAIQYAEISDVAALPLGWRQHQAPGQHELRQTPQSRRFAWANGPQALKPLLFAAEETLWTAHRDTGQQLRFDRAKPAPRPLAVIGVRACDLAALRLQDQHFLDRESDPWYGARRAGLFVVAVHCTHPAATCFCASTGDGPRAETGFDIALSETDEGYLVEAGTAAGESVCARLPLLETDAAVRAEAEQEIAKAASQQQRQLPPGDLYATLFERLDHPRWQSVAERCLACGNCTSVCPTCFCHRHVDQPALGGASSEHRREWDSCFSAGHSHLHGYAVRPDTRLRYRQWLTHKLGSWHRQFGRSGCVGCGRCITWCPVGIDITEEAAAICDGAGDGAA